jgi:hypothetical protein
MALWVAAVIMFLLQASQDKLKLYILVLLHPGQTETIRVFLAFRNELEETLSGVCDHEVEFFLKAN